MHEHARITYTHDSLIFRAPCKATSFIVIRFCSIHVCAHMENPKRHLSNYVCTISP